MVLLSQREISRPDFETARLLIFKFIEDFPSIYGEENVCYNLHLLIHMLESIDRWGAPWSTSAFLYEDVGGTLAKQFHGTRYLSEQIIQNFLSGHVLRRMAGFYIPRSTEGVQHLFQQLHTAPLFRENILPVVIGKGDLAVLDVMKMDALASRFGTASCNIAWNFSKVTFHGKLYGTKAYSNEFKRDNSVVLLKCGTVCEISMIAKCIPHCKCTENNQCLLPRDNWNSDGLVIVFFGETVPLCPMVL